MSILALIVGLLLGAAAVWLWARNELTRERGSAADRLELLERTEERIKAFTGEALTTSQRSLLDLADAKLRPIKDTLEKFESQAKELEERRLREVSAVSRQLRDVAEGQERLRAETGNLVTALRAPHVRGSWGEMQLRRVVELAGMESYCDYNEQQTFDTGEERGRPDMTVALPGNAKIFVDAKVPLNSYLDAVENSDEAVRREKFRGHAGAFKSHVDALAKKNYQRADGSVEFVVMFVPGEAFLSAACTENPDLIEYAATKGVYIASPLTLMALLRSYALGWQQRQQEENAKKIGEAARVLYDRMRSFVGHFSAIGANLEKANDAYNKAVASMESRVLPQGRKIKELASLPDADLTELQAIETAPREITALDAEQPFEHSRTGSRTRANQAKLFTDDTVA
jgi:DNA recombination protein RmuC